MRPAGHGKALATKLTKMTKALRLSCLNVTVCIFVIFVCFVAEFDKRFSTSAVEELTFEVSVSVQAVLVEA